MEREMKRDRNEKREERHFELHITKLIAALLQKTSLHYIQNGSFSTPNFVMQC